VVSHSTQISFAELKTPEVHTISRFSGGLNACYLGVRMWLSMSLLSVRLSAVRMKNVIIHWGYGCTFILRYSRHATIALRSSFLSWPGLLWFSCDRNETFNVSEFVL